MNKEIQTEEAGVTDLGAASERTLGVWQKYAEESTGLPDYRD
jgi:hypothetical protein